MALALTITSTGRDDLAQAISQSDSLTISNVVLTNSQTTGTLANITTASQLGGTAVATMTASGRRIDTGKVQVEGSDNSSATYEAKTLALTYTKGSETRVFALYTAAETFIYKVSDTAVMIVAAISIDDSQAQSITFSNVSITFPAATNSSLGSVKVATAAQLETPPAVDAANPLVPSVQSVSNALKSTLGQDSIDDNIVDIKKTFTVGRKAIVEDVYEQNEFVNHIADLHSSLYIDSDHIDLDSLTNDSAYWKIGVITGKFVKIHVIDDDDYDYVGAALVIVGGNFNGRQVGSIFYDDNGWQIKLNINNTSGADFYIYRLPSDSLARARNISSENIDASEATIKSLNAGGTRTLSFSASDFHITEAMATIYRLNTLIDCRLVNNSELNVPTLIVVVSGVKHTLTGTFSAGVRTWTSGSLTYKLDYGKQAFTCTGGTPQTGTLSFVEYGDVSVSGKIVENNVEISKCASRGIGAFLITPGGTITTTGATYGVSVSYSSSSISVTLNTTISESRYVFFELISSQNIFESGTRNSTLYVSSSRNAQGKYTASVPASITSNSWVLIKVY